MKQFLIKISIAVALITGYSTLKAQTSSIDLSSPIPLNDKIKTGKLDNGLTYFIMENKKPEKRVELRLVVNAGSILEDDDQRGLAHFTEHMAFNGTKNFKKNELVDYLQSVGVQFGAHLNAYTSFDETVYILPIPSDDEEILDKGLQILEDWSQNLLFDHEEIDKERGVVVEEWRLGQGAEMRMLDKYLPVIFKNSLYAERLPIGTKDILENFDYETIKRFYKDWYRPDLMAVMAVGDIDAEAMEKKIKERFGSLKNPDQPRRRISPEVPDHDETYVAIVSDKEASFSNVYILYKSDPEKITVGGDYRKLLISSLFTGMLNQRLRELQQKADPPFIFASTSAGSSWARTKTAFSAFSVVNESGIEKGLSAILEELRRVELHGFTEGEFKRQKLQLEKSYENAYNERDKTESKAIVGELVGHFLEEEPVPGIEYEYAFVKEHLSGIELGEVNALIKKLIRKDNRVVVITGPDKEGLEMPTEQGVLNTIASIESQQLDAYEDEEISDELVKDLPAVGKVVEQGSIDNIGVTTLTLANGAKVFLKPTNFKNDEIRMSAYSPGGHSLASDEDYHSAANASDIIGTSGIGDYSVTTLRKALAGKTASVSAHINELEEGLSGSCTPKDLETMMQLTHLYFTAPRKDEEAFQSFQARNKSILANLMANPQYYFSDKLQRILSSNHPRGGGFPTVEDIDKIDLDRAIEFYKGQFSNAGDFTFWFVGNFETEKLIPMIEKYIGSIAPEGNTDSWNDLGIRPPTGNVEEYVKRGTDPKSSVFISFTNDFQYKRQEGYYLQSLSEVLDIKLIEILREEKSGVYGVGASSSISKRPYPHYTMVISFPCGPENVEQLVDAAIGVVRDIQKNGVTAEDLEKIKEAQRRDLEVKLKENGFWLSALRAHHINGWDYAGFDNYLSRIDALTAEDLQRVAKQYLNTEEFIKIVHLPEE